MPEESKQPPPLPPRELKPTDDRAIYNTVTDLYTGLNVRKSDNVFQLKAIGVCIPTAAAIGYLIERDGLGFIIGGFIGLLLGLFGSGVFLGIYRAIRHARGKHD